MKRFIALFLSLVMTLSLCAPAWATEVTEASETEQPVEVVEVVESETAPAEETETEQPVEVVEVVETVTVSAEAANSVEQAQTGGVELEGSGTKSDPYKVDTAAELAEAVAAGGYIMLMGNVIENVTVSKSTTLDLNGYTVSSDDDTISVTDAGVVLTIKDSSTAGTGKVTSNGNYRGAVYVKNGKVIIESGTFEGTNNTKCYAAYVSNNGTLVINDGLLTTTGTGKSYGVVVAGSTKQANSVLEVNGGSITSAGFAISGNGSYHSEKITINDGTITSTGAAGIYHPQNGILTINGGTITGYDSGIAIKSGTLNVNAGTIRCTGPDTTPTKGYSNGVNASGAAIQIESSTDYAGNVVVNVAGGKVVSDNGAAVYEYLSEESDEPTTDTLVKSVAISKGDIAGKIQISEQLTADKTVVVSGGTFSVDPTAYVAEGYVATKSGSKYVVGVAPDVAEVGGVKYTDLQKAINAGGTVKLLANITLTEGVTVAKGATVVLDLNGKTVSMEVDAASPSALITNNGTLTIKDSGKNGTLSYATTTVSTGYSTSTIINNGTLTVTSGTIENTTSSTEKGAVYAIDSYGTLTVNGGTMTSTKIAIRQPVFSYDNAVTINNGTISGGSAGLQVHVFNDKVDITTKITGGSFSGTYAFYTYFYNIVDGSNVDIDVTGGTFDGYVYLYNHNKGSDEKPMDVAITNGYFDGGVYVYTYDASGNTVGIPAISGGYFTVAPADDYVVEGKVVVSSTKDGYPYTVGTKKTDVEVVVATPDVSYNKNLEGAELDAAKDIAEGGVEFCDDALTAQATTIANADKTKVTTDMAEKLEDVLDENIDKDDVVIVVKPYYDVTVKDVDLSGTTPTIKLDITPMYQKVATTQDVLDSGDELVTKEGSNPNAIAVGRPTEMKVTGAVDITVVIPASIGANNDTLYVTHKTDSGKTYVYEATVEEDNGVYTATFTNTHGFSFFTFSATNNIVASIGSDNYTSLQDALDAVKDGETIVVHKSNVDGETVKGSKKYEFTVDLADNVTNVTIENNGTETTLGNGGSGTFEVAKGSSGGSSGSGNYKPSGSGNSGSSSSGSSSSGKVDSAPTFDAGIALYVGMSIAAAAGSAVVIGKKKD